MTRINLLKAIYDNSEEWSCSYSCPHTMEEENPLNVCMECANKLLTEYEQQIRADAINEFAERVARTDINTSNYPMNQVILVKMQMLKK